MTDARFESARASNQAHGRGWDFTPAKPRRYPVNLIRVSAVLLVGVALFIAALRFLPAS